ncbi:MAG: DUF1223 domain-containing protein [Elusimicrobia bacterium]|nr:DUF1223 domain-containing protein [Elusimicrobiota bacterium]
MITAFLAFAAVAASAETVVYKAGPARVSLVELYSSEGCSSCPPADAWVASLRGAPGLWTAFVPVSFHVDYWDYLGWKDPLGAAENTARQRKVAARWGDGGVYTPGVVLDGEEWKRWGETVPAGGEAGLLEARVKAGRARAVYRQAPGETPAIMVVARLALGLSTAVTRGENEGRTLRHEFVVRGLARAPLVKAGDAWTAEAAVPAGREPRGEAAALAVWIEDAQGRPLQAAGGPL